MIRQILMCFVFLLGAYGTSTQACSISYRPNMTLMPPFFGEEPRSPDPPEITELAFDVLRKEADDGSSCGKAGVLYIFVKPSAWVDVPVWQRPMDIGYVFEIIESSGRDRNAPSVSIEEPISPYAAEDGQYKFTFRWRDSEPNLQRSIDVVLAVTAIDRWDRRSDPCFIRITHPGRGVERAVGSESPVVCR